MSASTIHGEWITWSIDGRHGAKLCVGEVFLGEISFPHDFGLGPRWRAWLNQHHLGFFRTEDEARSRIESEILRRMRQFEPAWAKFRARHSQRVVVRLPLQPSISTETSETVLDADQPRTAAQRSEGTRIGRRDCSGVPQPTCAPASLCNRALRSKHFRFASGRSGEI